MAEEILRNRDYTLIIDKSNSMSLQDQPEGKSRWQAAQESTFKVAQFCEKLDPDGITVYLFAANFRRYDNVTASKVEQIFQENTPSGITKFDQVLEHALNNYFERKSAGQAKENGETFLVITDGIEGEEEKKGAIALIRDASTKIDRDEELAISFIQVGKDPKVTEFLKALDDRMVEVGAKFDIVDTVIMEEMESMTLTDVLMNAIYD
ncbi:VWA domain-containing protein [Roseofilum capinflatum]|uniref:VWA domain-containing protein n=1 Tax=Roseofilum capinflatum TaxID=3082943 RepID=UPI0024BE4BAC|nr:VWA domain-containing protein [Roseofilum capinflatum]